MRLKTEDPDLYRADRGCQVPFAVTSITSVPLNSTVVPCAFYRFVAIVPIEMAKFLP